MGVTERGALLLTISTTKAAEYDRLVCRVRRCSIERGWTDDGLDQSFGVQLPIRLHRPYGRGVALEAALQTARPLGGHT